MNVLSFIYPIGLPIALSLVGYNAFLTGLFVYLKRRDEAGFRYFIVSTVISFWGCGLAFMLNNDLSTESAESCGRLSQSVAVMIPSVWFHFVLAYTGEVQQQKRTLQIVYFITLLILPFTSGPLYVSGFREMVGVKRYPMAGPAYIAFTIFFIAVVTYSFYFLYRRWRQMKSSQKRRDLELVSLASLYGFVTGSLSFFPVYGVKFPQLNLLIMPAWQIALAYGMVRYHLFDIEEIVRAARRDKLAAIGTLATSINHEIRNPLFVIQALAESHLTNLKENAYENKEAAFDKSTEILQKAVTQSTRAMEIMKSFAVFAKQEVKEEAVPDKVSLNETFDMILPLVSHELALDKIEFIKNIPTDLAPLKADRRHVEEILFNLIVNSCQAMKEHGSEGKIEVSAAQHNGSVHIKVEDNGPGIPSDKLQKIFEPFYTTKDEGTGLGLYVTKQLVEKNGGKISVKSRPGEGTTFSLEFKR